MTLGKYLTSKAFFLQLFLAAVVVAILAFLMMQWLNFATDHGNEIDVPDLRKLTEQQVEEKLEELNLEYVMLDSVDYNPNFPKASVVLQDPLPGAKVKEGRKIYIKLNSSNFSTIKVPDLIEKTLRQAETTIKALGLEIGKKTYKPYLGKDMVLEMHSGGKKLIPGEKIRKASVIDLVLGDGKLSFEETQQDTIPQEELEDTE
ncbi:PASTA domain-containing protein [Flavobacterium sp. NST-5]|uniref:PASTA domain-containing protein n=1 Tax=Flavobacterium ichthyis TaxID=2698827 RepID=A0ABW9ZAY5_9FLAO|nr:PASTA domain-containing protein [Flavobacterium ichthyis]NBL65291.1 PASTA domain-containing protein [Flavobacterium ichthyis]